MSKLKLSAHIKTKFFYELNNTLDVTITNSLGDMKIRQPQSWYLCSAVTRCKISGMQETLPSQGKTP